MNSRANALQKPETQQESNRYGERLKCSVTAIPSQIDAWRAQTHIQSLIRAHIQTATAHFWPHQKKNQIHVSDHELSVSTSSSICIASPAAIERLGIVADTCLFIIYTCMCVVRVCTCTVLTPSSTGSCCCGYHSFSLIA